MRHSLILLAGAVLAAVACSGGAEPGDEGFASIHVSALATLLASPAPPTVVDANGADFRAKEGVIPGALLLSNYKTYDVPKELPAAKDSPLVFYCADTH